MSRETTVHAREYNAAGECMELCSDAGRAGRYYVTREGVVEDPEDWMTTGAAANWYRLCRYRLVRVTPECGAPNAALAPPGKTEVES